MDSGLNIVVVEDHDDLREATVAALCTMGHVARGVECAEALDDELGSFQADLLILDLNLPGEDGISLARRIKSVEPDIGIIMVTARSLISDKTAGYDNGADIFLTKPISAEELGAAIQALSRRLRPTATSPVKLKLNPVTLQLCGERAVVDLSNLECTLLLALGKAKDHRMESWQLMELSGKSMDEFNKSALEAQIVRLRKKLEQAGAATPTLKAIRGIGYQLCTSLQIKKD